MKTRFAYFMLIGIIVMAGVLEATAGRTISQPSALREFADQRSPLEDLVGERLAYDLAFLWFDHLAEGWLHFESGEDPGTYRAILEAQTLGIAAFVTRDRRERHVSLMQRMPDGGLRSLLFESQTSKGRGQDREDRVRRYIFDYDQAEVYRERIRDGKLKRESYPMSNKVFVNDVLTAFYNFRSGYFGAIKPGKHFEIPTFSREGRAYITIDVLTEEQRLEDGRFPEGGLLCRVQVDKEIFKTGSGQVFLWLDSQSRPARGVVEDVLGLGDVRGTLRQ